jgi:hypothetical protein
MDKNQLSTDGVPIYSFRVSAGHWMRAHRTLLPRFHMLASSQLSHTFLSAAFKRYYINKHHRRSLAGLNSQHQGNCRSAHHGFMTSISISIRGVFFFGIFYFAFLLGKSSKKRAVSAATLWKHGSRIDGFSKHYFHNCPVFFFFLHVQKFSMFASFYCHAVNSGWLC